jgi:hypothetical protein
MKRILNICKAWLGKLYVIFTVGTENTKKGIKPFGGDGRKKSEGTARDRTTFIIRNSSVETSRI